MYTKIYVRLFLNIYWLIEKNVIVRYYHFSNQNLRRIMLGKYNAIWIAKPFMQPRFIQFLTVCILGVVIMPICLVTNMRMKFSLCSSNSWPLKERLTNVSNFLNMNQSIYIFIIFGVTWIRFILPLINEAQNVRNFNDRLQQ
jgi:hypothetical protein